MASRITRIAGLAASWLRDEVLLGQVVEKLEAGRLPSRLAVALEAMVRGALAALRGEADADQALRHAIELAEPIQFSEGLALLRMTVAMLLGPDDAVGNRAAEYAVAWVERTGARNLAVTFAAGLPTMARPAAAGA